MADHLDAAAGIPDVHSAAADLSLRYVDLNCRVNRDYGRLGGLFQAIIDPACAASGVSDAYPGWFAFAAFASRGIGQAQLGAEIALDAARFYHQTGDHRPLLRRVASGLVGALVREEARLAGTFLVGFASAFRHHGAFHGVDLHAMLEPRTFAVSVHRLLELLEEAPGSNPLERLSSVALTLRNTMEDGNRRIYADIGGAGQDYLTFRAGRNGNATPDLVLNEFPLSARPGLAHAAYQFALQHLADTPQPVRFGEAFPLLAGDARPLVVAGLALYELAGRTADLAAKNRCVAFANNFLIYREQQEALQPAFTPGRLMPGEVDRLKLLAIITPGIEVALRNETWTFAKYAEVHLPARSHDPLHSRATQYNWGVFEDRWLPITDTFGPCYRNPRAMWPAPSPDPNEGL